LEIVENKKRGDVPNAATYFKYVSVTMRPDGFIHPAIEPVSF